MMSQGSSSTGSYTDENGRRYRRDYTPDTSAFRNQNGGANQMTAPNQMSPSNQMTSPQ